MNNINSREPNLLWLYSIYMHRLCSYYRLLGEYWLFINFKKTVPYREKPRFLVQNRIETMIVKVEPLHHDTRHSKSWTFLVQTDDCSLIGHTTCHHSTFSLLWFLGSRIVPLHFAACHKRQQMGASRRLSAGAIPFVVKIWHKNHTVALEMTGCSRNPGSSSSSLSLSSTIFCISSCQKIALFLFTVYGTK